MFKTVDKPKALKKLVQQIGMEKYDYNGFDPKYGKMYFTKKFDENGNYMFATYVLIESGKNVIPSYGTKIDLLDKIMVNHLNGISAEDTILTLPEIVNKYYGTKIPKYIGKNQTLKFFKDAGYEVLYVRDTTKTDMLLKSVDVYLTKSNENFHAIKTVTFMESIDYAKDKTLDRFIEMDTDTLVIPKMIIE